MSAATLKTCPACGQTDHGQFGEYPCPQCGLPTVWDDEPSYKYALDADHNLVPGDVLTFKYQGSGVATFVDKDDTGFRIPIGTRNLAGVDADGMVHLEDEGEPVAPPAVSPDPELGTASYSDCDKSDLRDICKQRGIKLRGNPSEATLIALLEDADTPSN